MLIIYIFVFLAGFPIPVSLKVSDYWFLFHYSKGQEIKEYNPASVQVLLLRQVPAGGLSCDSAQSRCPLSQPNLQCVLSSQWENAVFLYQVGSWTPWEGVPYLVKGLHRHLKLREGLLHCQWGGDAFLQMLAGAPAWKEPWVVLILICQQQNTHHFLQTACQSAGASPGEVNSVLWEYSQSVSGHWGNMGLSLHAMA